MTLSNPLCGQSPLLKFVEPVLNDLPASVVKHALFEAFWSEERALVSIEGAFARLTSRRHQPKVLCQFFASWLKTHDCAIRVSGLANRLTLLALSAPSGATVEGLYRACGCLQRSIDEDLGALGNTQYSELFYNMVTPLCGDDRWRLRENCLPAARGFKNWRDARCLRDSNLLQGLLITLIHNICIQAEARFILPLFKQWLIRDMGMSVETAWATVAWITVHGGDARRNHVTPALMALNEFVGAMGVRLEQQAVRETFVQYLQRKSRVMRDCAQLLDG